MKTQKYNSKIPVYVSAGVLLAGTIWFARMDWHIRGEDIAELRAAVEERRMATWLVEPTQSLEYGFVWCKVIEDTTGGKITYTNATKESPLQYTSNDFTTGQRVDFFIAEDAPVGSYFEVAWYVDGIMQGERMIIVVERFPPGGNKTRASIGDITLEWRAWKFNRGENAYNYVWLDKAPQDMGDHILITERVTKNQLYDKIMAEARAIARTTEGCSATLPAVFWLSDDVTDGDILCMYSGAEWNEVAYTNDVGEDIGELIESYYTLRQSTNEGTMDKVRTTVARSPVLGQSVNMPGVSEIYAPLCARLYPETPTNIHNVGVDNNGHPGGRWWKDIGNYNTNYRYMCEDTVGVYTAHKIIRADLDQSANVLTNLKRTIALVPLSFLDTSNSVITKTFGTGNWTGTYFNAANPTYDLQKCVDVARAEAIDNKLTNNVASWDGSLCKYALNADAYLRYSTAAPDEEWRIEEDAYVFFETHNVDGILTNYPPALCLTNGMISRVRVYAVVYNKAIARPLYGFVNVGGMYWSTNAVKTMTSCAGDYSAISKALQWSLIGTPTVSYDVEFGDLKLPMTAPTLKHAARYEALDVPPPVFSLWLLADITDFGLPGAPPDMRVKFGDGEINWPDFKAWIKTTETIKWSPGSGDYEDYYIMENWDIYFESTIYCLAVVIDWVFDHMNPASPYEPTPHTPEWLSTNTP